MTKGRDTGFCHKVLTGCVVQDQFIFTNSWIHILQRCKLGRCPVDMLQYEGLDEIWGERGPLYAPLSRTGTRARQIVPFLSRRLYPA